MTDIKIPHEHLDLLRSINNMLIPEADYERDLLSTLIAAAEADQPPLPEGWVVVTLRTGSKAVFWHRNGGLYQWSDDTQMWDTAKNVRKTLTPLRPTVTEAGRRDAVLHVFDTTDLGVNDAEAVIDGAFAVAGIEVRDVD